MTGDGEALVDAVRYAAAALAGLLDSGHGEDPGTVRHVLSPFGHGELQALVLLLADCADKAKITAACGINPGLAAGNARRIAEAQHRAAEYAWLRDGRVSKYDAAERLGIKGKAGACEYENAYQAARGRQEGEAA